MLGGDGSNPDELLGEIQLSAVQEAMNQMMGSSATSMSTIFNKRVDISPPSVEILNIMQGEGTDKLPDDDMLVKVSFRLKIGTLVDSFIMQLLPLDFAKSLVNELLNPTPASIPKNVEHASSIMPSPVIQEQKEHSQQIDIGQLYNQTGLNQDFSNDGVQPSASFTQPSNPAYSPVPEPSLSQPAGPQHFGTSFQQGAQPNVQPAVFSSFEPVHLQESEAKNLDILLDIPLQVTVQLGQTKRTVKEILELSPGSIIELDKLAGEPVDILINNRLIAKGEVVVIDENFGVRVTDILSQSDRLKKLK
jgi:flagellar motor switch protein FliN/FliY